jgi:hypothetical protein
MNKLDPLKQIKMTDSEKKELFKRVTNSIHRLEGDKKPDFNYPVQSPFYRFTFSFHSVYMKAGVLALLVLSTSGATTYASLRTIPGDLLYGVKINVVEKVSRMAAVTPEGRVRTETAHIERRVKELEKLVEKGELTDEDSKIIEENINDRLDNINKALLEIAEKEEPQDLDAAKIDTDSTISITATEVISEKNEKEENETEVLEKKLEKQAEKIKELREREEVKDKNVLQSVLERLPTADPEEESADAKTSDEPGDEARIEETVSEKEELEKVEELEREFKEEFKDAQVEALEE